MITAFTLWFINRALDRGNEITGNVGCLVVLTGCIDTIIILGSVCLIANHPGGW